MEEQIRELGDFQLKLDKLKTAAASPKVKAINYYTEDEMIESEISKMTELNSSNESKFKKMTLVSLIQNTNNNESSPN